MSDYTRQPTNTIRLMPPNNNNQVGEKLGVPCDPAFTSTLHIIFRGIQVKGEYGWRWFVLDERRSFTD
ncbi:hypothetical protein Hanom_Chr03g00261861 [Helianthus anomalus]